jgi:protein-disulfide isomerase
MSNRQARREQSRQTRPQRTARPTRPAPGRAPKKPVSSGPDFLSRPYLIGVSVLVVVLAGVLLFVALRSSSGNSDVVKNLLLAHSDFPADLAKGNAVGKDDAPLKLTEYEDFQCPFCLRFTAGEEPLLVNEYVKTGKVQIIFKQLPLLGFESGRAASASLCAADQGQFWPYHDKLFLVQGQAGQDSNEQKNIGRFSDDKLKQYAADIGLDRTQFDPCLSSDKHLKEVQDQNAEARSLGLSGTPSFTINGQPIGAGSFSLEDWRKTLDAAYLRATASPTPAASASPAASPPAPTATKSP